MRKGRPFGLIDGSTLGVEVDGVTVDLVHRDSNGTMTFGFMLTPTEAHRLGEALLGAAFSASSPERPTEEEEPV